jgi:hypothetical protein
MRWFILIVGMLVMAGCAGSGSTRSERQQLAVQRFKDWLWKTGDSSTPQSYTDKSLAKHEQTTIRTLNNWIGNQSN